MKKIFFLVLVAACSLSLLGCAAKSTSPDGVNCSPKTSWQNENPDCVGGR